MLVFKLKSIFVLKFSCDNKCDGVLDYVYIWSSFVYFKLSVVFEEISDLFIKLCAYVHVYIFFVRNLLFDLINSYICDFMYSL